MMALEAHGLSKRYRGNAGLALDSVDLEIPQGAMVALVGPNGAGKSTLIHIWMGFERPTAGRARVAGVDVATHPKDAIRAVGYVGQRPGLYRDLTPNVHIDLASALRSNFDRQTAVQLMDRLAIPDRPAGSLSGGQQAQVALTLAIGTGASILLLDEPMASMDPLVRREFLNALRSIASERGTTTLLSSHVVGDLEGVCDRIIILAPSHVLLHESVAVATRSHIVTDIDAADAVAEVGTFVDASGKARSLRKRAPGDDPEVRLEELVLGYLAASRDLPPS